MRNRDAFKDRTKPMAAFAMLPMCSKDRRNTLSPYISIRSETFRSCGNCISEHRRSLKFRKTNTPPKTGK